MKKFVRGICSIAVGAVLFQGCSHGAIDKRIDDKLSQENKIKTRSDLNKETSQTIQMAPGLNGDQKSRLSTLQSSTMSQMNKIREESLKLRSLLVKDVVSSNYDADEVQAIKARLQSLENKRLSILFEAVDKANSILGHQAPQHQRIVHELMEPRGERWD